MPKNCMGSISNLVQLFSGTGNIAAADTLRFAAANLVIIYNDLILKYGSTVKIDMIGVII